MSRQDDVAVDDVLNDLVHQFSDPMAFFRELVQNSIDAGTLEIDIRIEFNAPKSDTGTLIVHVDDFGEGMNREIIETKLTRLFSSTKDDDFTKIGRFGIGFVSVFAVEPEAVIVDTARGGESWRVVFSADRTFDLIRLDTPGEGTQVKLIKTMTRSEFQDFKHRAREVIQKWCKHAPIPIYFDDQDIRLPFDVESICKVTFEEEGTRLVAGYTPRAEAPYGYYNQGLTLREGGDGPWPLVTFKIDSRYLEHTLTRDQVLEDRHFHKAIETLETVASTQLPQRLIELLEEAARGLGERYDDLMSIYYQVDRIRHDDIKGFSRRAFVRVKNAEPIALRDALRSAQRGRLFALKGANHLVPYLDDDDSIEHIVDMSWRTHFDRIIETHSKGKLHFVEDRWQMPDTRAEVALPGLDALQRELDALSKEVFERRISFDFGAFVYPGSMLKGRLAWLSDSLKPQRPEELRELNLSELNRSALVVFNLDDEAVSNCLAIAAREPEWAACQLLILLTLADQNSTVSDQLTRHAVEARKQRVS